MSSDRVANIAHIILMYRKSPHSAVSISADFAIVRFWKFFKSSHSAGKIHYSAVFSTIVREKFIIVRFFQKDEGLNNRKKTIFFENNIPILKGEHC